MTTRPARRSSRRPRSASARSAPSARGGSASASSATARDGPPPCLPTRSQVVRFLPPLSTPAAASICLPPCLTPCVWTFGFAVHYVGTLPDGTLFASTRDGGGEEPRTINLGSGEDALSATLIFSRLDLCFPYEYSRLAALSVLVRIFFYLKY